MMQKIDDMSVRKKVLLGFSSVLAIFAIVGAFAIYTISSATGGFQEYRSTAISTNQFGRIQANLLTARLEGKNFLKNGDQKFIQPFNERIQSMLDYTQKEYERNEDPEIRENLSHVKETINKYRAGYDLVVEKMNTRNDIVENQLNVLGVQVVNERLLPAMERGNVLAGKAVNHMLLGRLYVIKFLDDNKQAYVDRVKSEFALVHGFTTKMGDPVTDNLVKQYESSFDALVTTIRERNEIVENVLDHHGPEIAEMVEQMKLDNKAHQDALGPELQAANDRGTTITAIVTIVAICFGLWLGVLLSNRITKPVVLAHGMMQELSKGKLSTRLNLKNSDEIGEMGRAMDSFADSLSSFTRSMHDVSNGNLAVKVDLLDEADELSPAFNKIVGTLRDVQTEVDSLTVSAKQGKLDNRGDAERFSGDYRKIISGFNGVLDEVIKPMQEGATVLEQMATGDLTVRMQGQYKGDFALIKNSVNGLGDSLSRVLGDVTDAVENTATSSRQISSGSESVAQGAMDQSAKASEAAVAVEEMTQTIAETSQNATRATQIAQEAVSIAVKGDEVVNSTINGMQNIAEVVKEAADTVKALGKNSDQIGEIIQVIDDIANQTNLLALNAAIEAARAGEQGRGFAVVADEVRKLAERTTKATKEIADTIEQIQHDTALAVQSMESGTVEVSKGIEYAAQSGESLKQILEGSNETLDIINQVAAASEEQSSVASHISENIEGIRSVSEQSASETQQIADSSGDLLNKTMTLREIVQQFTINRNNGYALVERASSGAGQADESQVMQSNGKLLVS